jgi:hypothetical protein
MTAKTTAKTTAHAVVQALSRINHN